MPFTFISEDFKPVHSPSKCERFCFPASLVLSRAQTAPDCQYSSNDCHWAANVHPIQDSITPGGSCCVLSASPLLLVDCNCNMVLKLHCCMPAGPWSRLSGPINSRIKDWSKVCSVIVLGDQSNKESAYRCHLGSNERGQPMAYQMRRCLSLISHPVRCVMLHKAHKQSRSQPVRTGLPDCRGVIKRGSERSSKTA